MEVGKTGLEELASQIQKYWSPLMTKQLREDKLLVSLVNKDYDGEIKEGGNAVTVSQMVDVEGQNLDISGGEGDTFTAEKIKMKNVQIVADKRAVAAVEVSSLAKLQSQLNSMESDIRDTLVNAVEAQINKYLYSLVSPSAATPDHVVTGIASMSASNLLSVRTLASTAKWPKSKPFYGLLDPTYYGDVLTDTILANNQYGANDAPVIGGQTSLKRLGFNLLEDNSRSTKNGLFFYPDFMHLVMQTQLEFKLSDLHAQGKFGYLLSANIIYGAKLGIEGNLKHITVAA